MTPETVKSGPRGNAETGPQNSACLAACDVLITAHPESGQEHLASRSASPEAIAAARNVTFEALVDDLVCSPADWRLATRGLSECEMALLDCTPAVSDPDRCTRLYSFGLPSIAGLHIETVVLLPNNRFEFARHVCDVCNASGAVVAVVFLAPDDLGNPLDIAAWNPETGRLALWLGRVPMLGQDNLYAWRLGDPVTVHETPLDWLQAGREGVFVIDPERASPLLRMVEPLGVRRLEFGRQLRSALTVRPPRILVESPKRVAA